MYGVDNKLFFIFQIDQVCDDSTHNDEAPTQHNRVCGGRSVTSVLYTHPDFNETKNLAARSPYSPPVFQIKKLRPGRTIAFVVDSSRSMDGSRLYLAKQVRIPCI